MGLWSSSGLGLSMDRERSTKFLSGIEAQGSLFEVEISHCKYLFDPVIHQTRPTYVFRAPSSKDWYQQFHIVSALRQAHGVF
jgi:hypothetical protein